MFAVVALTRAYTGAAPNAHTVTLGWFNPFTVNNSSDFTQAMLAGIFIYWGWDTGATVNEETQNPRIAPARAAIPTTLLVVLYVIVSMAAVAFDEPALAAYQGDDFLAPLATTVLGPGMDKVLIFAVLTSAAACTQTTILPTARTIISMARAGALPGVVGQNSSALPEPGFATLAMGAVSGGWYLGLILIANRDVLSDSVTATAIGIAFYYGLTGIACVAYYRRELRKDVKSFILIGVVPALGGLIMFVLFVEACINYSSPDQGKTSFYGIGAAVIFGVGGLALGLILMALARLGLPDFFKRKREVFKSRMPTPNYFDH